MEQTSTMTKVHREVKKYLSKIGKKGGKANTSEGQAAKGKSTWKNLSPGERSKIMSERRRKGIKNAKK